MAKSAEEFLGKPSAEEFLNKLSAEDFLSSVEEKREPINVGASAKQLGQTILRPVTQSVKAAGTAKEFLIDKPGEAAPIVRNQIAEFIGGPSVSSIEETAARTKSVPMGMIAKRVAAETAAEIVPLTPIDFAMDILGGFGIAKAASMVPSSTMRLLKTPFGRMSTRRKVQKELPDLLSRVKGREKIRSAEEFLSGGKQPIEPLVKPGVEEAAGPVIPPGAGVTRPITGDELVGPIDKTKPPRELILDSAKLTGNEHGPIEPIVPGVGPVTLAENQVTDTVGMVAQREFLDRLTPAKGIPTKGIAPEFEAAGGGYSKSYVQARLLAGKIRGRATSLFDKVNVIVKPLKNADDRAILNEIYSLRNFRDLDIAGRRTSDVTSDMASKKLAQIEAKIGKKKFDSVAKVADDLASIQNNDALDLLVDAKVISQKTAGALRKRFPNYIRSEILDNDLRVMSPYFKGADGQAISKINRGFLKTKKGTTKLINTDVLDVVRRSLLQKVAVAEKQKVIDQFAREFGVQIGKRTTRESGTVRLVVDTNKVPPGYVKSNVRTSDGKVVAVPEEIERILGGLDQQESDIITRAMTHYNTFFRAGATTMSLPFVMNNVLRDFQNMFFNARILPGQKSRIVAAAEGMTLAIAEELGIKTSTMKAFRESGAGFGGLLTSLPKEIKLPFRLLSRSDQIKKGILKPVILPFELVGKLSRASENTFRLAEFVRLRGTNLPKELKALNARDITVDFEKSGNALRLFNRWIPFLNAQVQGDFNVLRALQAQPLTSTARLTYMVGLPALGLYAWNKQFKNDDKVDPFIKNNFYYINTGIKINRENQPDIPVLLTLRKAEFAKPISNAIEIMTEMADKDPGVNSRVDEYRIANIAQATLSRLTPPAIRAGFEQATNFDLFRGRQIVSRRLENVEPKYQFNTFTSNSARRLGEMTGVAPVRLEHAGRSIFPASKTLFEAADVLLKPSPLVKRKESEQLRRTESVFPTVRGASGFFSPERREAFKFKQEKAVEKRTPRFLFEQAAFNFFQNPTEENREVMLKLRKRVPGKGVKDIVKKVRKELALRQRSGRIQAIQRTPKSIRPEFIRRLREQQ